MSYVQALDWTEDNKRGYGASGYGYIYAWGKITNWQDNDDNLSFTWNVYCCGTSSGAWAGPAGYGFNLAAAWVDNSGGEHHINGTDSYYWYGNIRSDSTNISINKTRETQTIKLYFDHDSKTVDGYGGAPGDLLWDWRWIGTVIVSSKPSYTVSYNKNTEDETTNLPSNQTKWYGEDIVISSKTPQRSGYTFQGWALSPVSSIIDYNLNDTYTENMFLTLYAIWQSNSEITSYPNEKYIGKDFSKTIWTTIKKKLEPDILYNAEYSVYPFNYTHLNFPVNLNKSVFDYEKIIIEVMENDTFYQTYEILYPSPDKKYLFEAEIISSSGYSYVKVLTIQFSNDGKQINKIENMGERYQTDTISEFNPYCCFIINKIIGIKKI